MQKARLGVLSAMVAASFYACGGGGEPPKNVEPTPSASAAPSATPAPSASAAPAASASAQPSEPPPLAFEGIHGTVEVAGKTHAFVVKSDGTLVTDGKPEAAFVKNELRDAERKKVAYAVAADGTISGQVASGAKFDDKDDIVMGSDYRLTIGADGVPVEIHPKKRERAPIRFETFPAKSRRAATLIASSFTLSLALKK